MKLEEVQWIDVAAVLYVFILIGMSVVTYCRVIRFKTTIDRKRQEIYHKLEMIDEEGFD
jgi:hypothetical protein